jgi:putative holliday junction resolvase
MPLLSLAAFQAALPPAGALVGLDPGSRTIGVAVSDATRLIASPVEGIARKKFAVDGARVLALADSRGARGLVIGHPLNLDGSAGPSAQAARAFARNLLGLRDLPVLLWDERLSTAAVQRQMIEADVSRARRAREVDAAAAAFMLQGLLDRLRETVDPAPAEPQA